MCKPKCISEVIVYKLGLKFKDESNLEANMLQAGINRKKIISKNFDILYYVDLVFIFNIIKTRCTYFYSKEYIFSIFAFIFSIKMKILVCHKNKQMSITLLLFLWIQKILYNMKLYVSCVPYIFIRTYALFKLSTFYMSTIYNLQIYI